MQAYETIGADRLRAITLADGVLWSLAFLAVVTAVGGSAYYAAARTMPAAPLGAPPPAVMLELAPISMAPPAEEIAAEDGEFSPFEQAASPANALPTEAPDMLEPLDITKASPVEPANAVPAEDMQEPEEPAETVEPMAVEPLEEIVPDVIEADNAEVYVPSPLALPETIAERRQAFAQAQVRERREREMRRQAASQQTAPRSVDATPSEQIAAPVQTESTRRMPTVSPERWNALLTAHLARNTRYPPEARRRGEIGLPWVYITIDASGTITSRRIAQSSGFASLDEAALQMLDRASPVPAPPPDYAGQLLRFPVNFNIRR